MKYYNKILPLLIIISITLFFYLTSGDKSYKVKKMNTPIVSFDWMKISHDDLSNQKPKELFVNIATLVKKNFPGTTHIAISTPMNSQAEFLKNVANHTASATTPAPLTIEAFIDMQLDVIHDAGFNAVIRSIPCEAQGGLDGFDTTQHTSDYWVNYNKAFLDTHKAHIKDGDVIAIWYEGLSNEKPIVVNDTGNTENDYNTFWQKNAKMVYAWAAENGYKNLRERTDVAGLANSATFAAIGAIVHDHYGTLGHLPLKTNQEFIDELKAQIMKEYNAQGGKYPFYEQEWGDIRNSSPSGSIQEKDPGFTAQIADELFFPLIKSGVMEGIGFWCLFDTRKEGIITIAGNTATLNAKGLELAKIFKKWYGGATPPEPTPVPDPTPTPPISGQSITSFTLIDTNTQKPVAGFDPITNNVTISLAKIKTKKLNIRANANPAKVGSVQFGYDNNSKFHIENFAPYALAGKNNDKFKSWTPSFGKHTISATPFDKNDAKGSAGKKLTITITITS